ncbi:MAG: ABC transporter ATP-binding protein [Alphaproteobacteria bacterium]
MALLEIENLSVDFRSGSSVLHAVDSVSLTINESEVLAIVGESGSGKSVAMLAVMGLLPSTADISADCLSFGGQDLRSLTARRRRHHIGKDMAMIFQEPMTSLNPCFTIGFQLVEALRAHLSMSRRGARARALELLGEVGISSPERRMSSFPHQLSGGMNQRVMIAMALACKPRLLIADEPTTALDVTIQAQILDLLLRLQRETGMALVLITHSMGVVAETADRVCVQYAGRKMEEQDVSSLFSEPRHPYTSALLTSLPERTSGGRLPSIPGVVPGLHDRPRGCLFSPRCSFANDRCREEAPRSAGADYGYALCHTPLAGGVPQEDGGFRP